MFEICSVRLTVQADLFVRFMVSHINWTLEFPVFHQNHSSYNVVFPISRSRIVNRERACTKLKERISNMNSRKVLVVCHLPMIGLTDLLDTVENLVVISHLSL